MEQGSGLIRLVLLTVGGQTYALHLEVVERVLRMVEITPLPGAPDAVQGVINIRGEIIPVVSIRRRLDLAHRDLSLSDSLVVARTDKRCIAIIAETVPGVVERSPDAVVTVSDISGDVGHIEGVLKMSDGLVLIQDMNRFFSSAEDECLDLALERG